MEYLESTFFLFEALLLFFLTVLLLTIALPEMVVFCLRSLSFCLKKS